MCGINGFISYEKTLSKKESVSRINHMNDLIVHRGPDDDGIFHKNNGTTTIAMGMRRLSIIDLHSGKQPIFSEDRQLVIVFNGEIYNYLELKEELISNGITFKTNSDTEVILKLYENYGVSSFKRLDGMFAFSIYDKGLNKVFIARDFFGEKPLYYIQSNGCFIWASELKSITNDAATPLKIDKVGLNLYLRLTYIPAPYSIYEGVHKLPPYSYITYDLSKNSYVVNQIETEAYPEKTNSKISLGEAKTKVKSLVTDSVVSRSISDVPLGTFLSGGVDSSIVSLCLSQYKSEPIETFSIGFKKKSFDETDKSQLVAKMIHSNHHEFIIDEKDIEEDLHQILNNFDEPFADSSALPTYLVSKKTREHVTVALTGDGGDEVFGGYNKYYMGKFNSRYTSWVPKSLHSIVKNTSMPFLKTSNDNRGKRYRIKRLLNSFDYNGGFYWDIISLGYTNGELNEYLLSENQVATPFKIYKDTLGIDAPKSLTDFRLVDRHISLEGDMLVKVDRTSMLNSLECRAPFLNKQLWNYVNTLPENFLLNGWNKKFLLKEAFKDEFPEGFLDKSKSGFGAPVGDWLKTSLSAELKSYIETDKLERQGIFNVETITKLVREHLSGTVDNTFKVWTFYCFQKWYFNTYIPK
ncbi:asparagine synthase (glutamine-hydrolyzing) [Flagellimonas halotolerans]|uniref:asparagine synthase (glutamine-hydrolyzing) n=1 Tax=Flagellimonas halotolerans TaxID=3112164 RepID=A0ABU6IST3_9FLAO|nr:MULTISPECIES: asparagine synthase (glutamine-hydrolyzing) [unclassified Allomuricauda]MEC3966148.1 asparagine synthase (glutamine-hydrolyzing) [Muricauda sp. SYSU M86414]MEC4266013.1 asparagine synthase (glutamine-hydrolyzing) [Muricauda sp. SYSU M84420]